jgi:hypothetical protein
VLLKLQILPGTIEGPELLSGGACGNIDYFRSETGRTAEAFSRFKNQFPNVAKIELVDGREKTNRNEFPK